jgi:hypothetical protein
MLIMMLCEVNDDNIILEYSKSFVYLNKNENYKKEMIDDMLSHGLNEDFIYSKQTFMQDLLKKFRFKYYSINKYLLDIGFDRLDQKAFINKYKK